MTMLSCRTVRIPCHTYFRTVHGLADRETMKLHGPFAVMSFRI